MKNAQQNRQHAPQVKKNAPQVNLHIERLVLEGMPLSRREGLLVQAAVEAELARLLSAEGAAAAITSGGAVPSLDGGSIQLARESSPAHMGMQIARAVYGGLSR